MTPDQITTFNQVARGTALTQTELMHGIPSADRLIFNWVVKCYFGILAACGITSLLFVLIPYAPESLTQIEQIEIDPLHYLIAVAIITQIYYRIKDKILDQKN